MKKHYLFFVSVAYSYPILRPLQDEIRRRGDEVAWFVEPDCPVLLDQDERWLQSVQEVMDYQPIAVFAPGNYIYDFFPGVKVSLFHGYPIKTKKEQVSNKDRFHIILYLRYRDYLLTDEGASPKRVRVLLLSW